MTPADEFRCFAEGYWNEARSGQPSRAALNTEALELLVAGWRAEGSAAGRLESLLGDPGAEVRYFAAALLGPEEPAAIAALEGLARDPAGGLPAEAARAWLRGRRRRLIAVIPADGPGPALLPDAQAGVQVEEVEAGGVDDDVDGLPGGGL